jgi:hypothetical protein
MGMIVKMMKKLSEILLKNLCVTILVIILVSCMVLISDNRRKIHLLVRRGRYGVGAKVYIGSA